MKILLDARFYGLENAGLGRYTMNLVEEISNLDRKNEYVLLLRDKYFNQLKYPSNFTKVRAEFSHYSLKEQTQLVKLIVKISPNLTHFPHFNIPLFYRGPFVVTIHDLLMHKQKGRDATTLMPHVYYVKRLAYKAVFKHAILASKKIIVPSDTVKKEVINYYKITSDKVNVIYEGVHKIDSRSKNSEKILKKYGLGKPYFVYVGNAYPHKNLKRAIDAVVRLNQHSDCEFAIISARNIFTEKLAKEIKNTIAKRYVKLPGFVPDQDLEILYKKSVGFLFPSLSEGFGLPGIEAIQAGTVLLASNIPVFREIYQDCAKYYDPYRTDDVVRVMTDVLNMDKSVRDKFISKGQSFVKRYTWKKTAQSTLKVYSSLG